MRKLKQQIIDRYPEFAGRVIGEYPLKHIASSAGSGGIKGHIPPVLYQTWETNKLGKTHFEARERFIALNPELEFRFFDALARDQYMEEHYPGHPILNIYKRGRFGPLRVDIWRYCLLAKEGGFYFDINKGIEIPIAQLLNDETSAFISYESTISHMCPPLNVIPKLQHPHNLVVNWGFGFAKNHPFMVRMIQNLCDYYPFFAGKLFEQPKNAIVKFTGPIMLTRSIHDVLASAVDPAIEKGMTQCGIDFNRLGIANMPRSWTRYAQAAAYAKIKNQVIVD